MQSREEILNILKISKNQSFSQWLTGLTNTLKNTINLKIKEINKGFDYFGWFLTAAKPPNEKYLPR